MNYFTIDDNRGVAGLVIVPEENKCRIYVAWDWNSQVEKGIVSFYKSRKLYDYPTKENIIETCKEGFELSQKEAVKIFSKIIPAKKIKGNNMIGVY